MNFFTDLFSNNEKKICSITLGTYILLISGVIMSAYALYMNVSSWNPLTYGGGLGGLLVGLGGGKRLRDGATQANLDPGASDPDPEETK